MTVEHKRTALRLAVAGMALGLVVAGCSKEEESTSTSSSASSSAASSAATSTSAAASATSTDAAPASGDLSVLLIKPEAIPPGPAGPWVAEPAKSDPAPPASITQFFKSGDSNAIQSSIFLLPDEASAAKMVTETLASPNMAALVKGTPAPAPNVNKTAQVINGTSADGTASMSVLMFSEGKIVAQVQFMGKAGDPVTPDYLDTVGVIQLDTIQQNMSKVG